MTEFKLELEQLSSEGMKFDVKSQGLGNNYLSILGCDVSVYQENDTNFYLQMESNTIPCFNEVDMKMENMTEERIDKVIDSAFLEINEYPAYSSQLASNLAAFKTARDHCIEIFKSVLKELLCG